ncbi:DUF262 domain-containing protein [Sporosalibacterium faouarense]|uniref:DUF262 domain-containing protein n=1 Tax=Sporosalibacterium faouarense TaxID=516123 RepID=UPI00192BCA34|nr:DUF262 domain-containing protein [Sporosalibacterium faouarense]
MTTNEFSNLRDEIESKRGEIYTHQLTMSVGELINLYQESEINLDPAFQRLFRWDSFQETSFIESILLGYPIPAIFVLQRDDGVWDVIDGVQRLSTIYHFADILKDENDEKITPLQLEKAKILKHLEGKYYYTRYGDSLDTATKIDFKRSSLPVIILKHGSEKKSKFELFKRLNTGGSHLSPQEIRNALILMSDEDVYNSMDAYCKKDSFITMINIPDSKSEIRMDMDILTRFLVMRNYEDIDDVPNSADINEFLDDAIEQIITRKNFNINEELNAFDILINFLSDSISDDYGFKVYDKSTSRFKGAFNWFVFETLIWGCTVLNNPNTLLENKAYYIDKIKNLNSIGTHLQKIGKSNIKVIQRLKEAKEEAKKVFTNE